MDTAESRTAPRRLADRRIPDRDLCVVRPLLESMSALRPDATFVRLADGRDISYREMLAIVRSTAAALQKLGVRQGDHVISWLPNNLDVIRLFLALNYLGAVFVPINTAYRGGALEHAINLSDAKLMVLHADLADRLSGLKLTTLEAAVVTGGVADLPQGIALHDVSMLDADPETLLPLERPIEPWDTLCITFTSGTTGPSKAVMSSYLHYYALSTPESSKFLTEDDRYLLTTPLFHISSTARLYAMLRVGGSIAVAGAFRTDGFWETVRSTGSTTATLMGAMATFLLQHPPSEHDRNHSLRNVAMLPMIDDVDRFVERFGVDVYTFFNMTETSRPIVSTLNPSNSASCGCARPGVEIRLVDENDCEVAVGEVGELIVRTDMPWALSHGYYRDPENTAKAWRNGWFHTGDGFKKDEEGNFYFVDRLKDTIRRRGENISSFQVESEVAAHPEVREVAAFPVPSEHGESEVMVAISLRPGATLTPEALIKFLIPRMPYFAVPRFVRIVDDLPKTPTQKIEKHVLRSSGVVDGTFDREKAGVHLRRERIDEVAGPAKSR